MNFRPRDPGGMLFAFRRALLLLGSIGIELVAAAPLPPEPGALRVTARTIEPEPIAGELLDFTSGTGATILRGAETIHVVYDRLITLAFTKTTGEPAFGGPRSSPPRTVPAWTLTNGDRLLGPAAGSGREVVIECPVLGRIAMPTDRIRRFRTPAADSPSFRELTAWFDRQPTGEDDAVLLTNGDVLKGLVRQFDSEAVVMDSGGGESRVPYRLVLEGRLANPQEPADPGTPKRVRAILRQGMSLTFGALEIHGGETVGRYLGDTRLEFPADVIDRLEIIGGRWEWLSEHPVVSYQHVPMLGLGWDYKIDRNVLGDPLRVGGPESQVFERGIGVHSQSRLAFELKGQYSEFVTAFCMDESAGPLADVTAAILVDGQKRFEKTHVKSGVLFDPVRLDVTKASRLELVVEFGDHGDVQDRFNWIDPGLIRAP